MRFTQVVRIAISSSASFMRGGQPGLGNEVARDEEFQPVSRFFEFLQSDMELGQDFCV